MSVIQKIRDKYAAVVIAVIALSLIANGTECARGEMVAVEPIRSQPANAAS